MVEASVPVADAADLLDQQVDGFGGSVAGTGGVEVGQVLASPGGQGAAQAGYLGYGTIGEVVDQFGGVCAGRGQVFDRVGQAQLWTEVYRLMRR